MKATVNLACGLANRMFQYSYYLWLRQKGWVADADFYTASKLAHEQVPWSRIFPNATYPQASKFSVFLRGGDASFVSRFRRKFLMATTKVEQMPTAFTAKEPTGNNHYMIGVFQNAQMVEEVAVEVRKAFAFQPYTENPELLEAIQAEGSIGIHVRKGKDYASRIWYQNTCSVDYYRRAIEHMKAHVKSPKIFVFTDNPEWVKEHFKGTDYTLVEGHPTAGYGCHYDMQLMSLCHHLILSNSTYSWWGAFLNERADKNIIIPTVWFNPDSTPDFTSAPIRCKGWIGLE